MKINILVLGPLETNCYIIQNNKNEAIIIDPADNSEEIINFCHNLKHNNFHSSIFNYEVIKTPGHTDDSIAFYFKNENILFGGDFIFNGSIGRFDFPNSNVLDMQKSLEMISNFDDNMLIYPGHGPKTILKNEKKHFKYYY